MGGSSAVTETNVESMDVGQPKNISNIYYGHGVLESDSRHSLRILDFSVPSCVNLRNLLNTGKP